MSGSSGQPDPATATAQLLAGLACGLGAFPAMVFGDGEAHVAGQLMHGLDETRP